MEAIQGSELRMDSTSVSAKMKETGAESGGTGGVDQERPHLFFSAEPQLVPIRIRGRSSLGGLK